MHRKFKKGPELFEKCDSVHFKNRISTGTVEKGEKKEPDTGKDKSSGWWFLKAPYQQQTSITWELGRNSVLLGQKF